MHIIRNFIQRHLTILFCLALIPIVFFSLFSGYSFSFFADFFQQDNTLRLLILEIRLPRILLTMAIGFTLGFSGALLQGYFRNPLADPSVLGFSSSGVLGAVYAFYFLGNGLHFDLPFLSFLSFSALQIPFMALLATALSAVFLFVLTARIRTPGLLILAGIALSGLTTAFSALLLAHAPNPWALSEIINWMMGSTDKASWQDVILVFPFMGVGILFLRSVLPALDSLSLGEETAQSLGVSLKHSQILLIIGMALAIGGSVATTGQIGFIGLIAPHIVRPIIRYQPSELVWPSALCGTVLLLTADLIVHIMPGGRPVLPIGIVTALMGTPFFFLLIFKLRKTFFY